MLGTDLKNLGEYLPAISIIFTFLLSIFFLRRSISISNKNGIIVNPTINQNQDIRINQPTEEDVVKKNCNLQIFIVLFSIGCAIYAGVTSYVFVMAGIFTTFLMAISSSLLFLKVPSNLKSVAEIWQPISGIFLIGALLFMFLQESWNGEDIFDACRSLITSLNVERFPEYKLKSVSILLENVAGFFFFTTGLVACLCYYTNIFAMSYYLRKRSTYWRVISHFTNSLSHESIVPAAIASSLGLFFMTQDVQSIVGEILPKP